MKKLILASFGVLLASLSFGQTFTVTNIPSSGQADWELNGLILNCPQSSVKAITSGTLIEGIQQANLGRIKKIVFDPSVSSVNLNGRWQQTSNICGDKVSIIGPTNRTVTIFGNSGSSYKTFTFTGKNDTISNLTFQDAYIELNGTSTVVSNNVFKTSQAIGSVFLFNTKYNTIINNTFSSTFSSGGNSAIRIGTNQPENIDGNTVGDKILYNKVSGFWNGLQAGQWKKTVPVCDSLTIRGNEFYSNRNAGAYLINSTGSLIDSNFVYSNQGGGIFVEDCKYVKVFANAVGVDKLGNVLGNLGNGINVNGGNNIKVGDPVFGPNLVLASGNNSAGAGLNNAIAFDKSQVNNLLAKNSSIKANFLGVKPDGTGDLSTGTKQCGIYFGEMASVNVLNDTIGGATISEGNSIGYFGQIGGAVNSGIQINKNSSTVLVWNNFIGISKLGTPYLNNQWDGIAFRGVTNSDIFGNRVGNNIQGIALRFSNDGQTQTSQVTIRGNYCGTSNGKDSHPNRDCGISFEYGTINSTLGGINPADSNYVRNEAIGVWIASDATLISNTNSMINNKITKSTKQGILFRNNSINNLVQGNILDSNVVAIQFGEAGRSGVATNPTITKNIIKNSTSQGILVTNVVKNLKVTSNKLSKNTVGVSFTGAADSPNLQSNTIDSSTSNAVVIDAVVLNYKSQNNKIQRTTAGNGVYVNKAIKTAEFRTDTVSENSANGYLFNTGTQSIIGGTNGEGNVIYKNGSAGIRLTAAAANEIQMRRNSISCNAVAGIKLEGNANAEFSAISDKILIDTSATTKDTIVGVVNINSPYANGIIEAFDKGPTCKQTCVDEVGRQGYKYIGQAVSGVDGKFRLGLSSPITEFKNITFTVTTKTATNTTGKFSTSEFSRCTNILPVSFLKVSASSVAQGVLVKWTTASETNNEYFVVQRSKDGIHFETISGEIQGAGNSFTATNYSFVDTKPNEGINYYKIKQVDFNGTSDYSKIVAVNLGSDKVILIAPNPSKGEFTIKVIGDDETAYRVNVFNALGQLIFDSNLDMFTGYAEKKFDISNYATGVYTVHLISETKSWTKKLIKE